jgi:hypothetical protein
MDDDRDGYAGDELRPDPVSAHTLILLVHVALGIGFALLGLAGTLVKDVLKH